MPAVLVLPDFDHSRVAEVAKKVLTERQVVIWTRTHRDGWTASRLAKELGVCRATVENDLRASRKRLREAMEHVGEGSNPFRVTIQREGTTENVLDSTPAGAARGIEREEKRRGQIEMA